VVETIKPQARAAYGCLAIKFAGTSLACGL